ncbi:Hypothetical_protein [Hexamita inflata]|uniref:Hypothetical_protein n=1 Tax=Hexamita inflata TaxID=28002 RepID=A0AA86VJY3_9EUKA|nr:Hypothetical protein HINF_LOCUS56463 [Hexamita inflata]
MSYKLLNITILSTTQPHSEGGSIFAYKGVGQLAYKGVGHEVTPLQASDKFHVFQPRFLTVNPSNSTIFLDTFWIHFTYKGVENDNPLISEKATLENEVIQQINN